MRPFEPDRMYLCSHRTALIEGPHSVQRSVSINKSHTFSAEEWIMRLTVMKGNENFNIMLLPSRSYFKLKAYFFLISCSKIF